MKKYLRPSIALLLLATTAYAKQINPSAKKAEPAPPPRPSSDVFLSSPIHTFEVQINALLVQPTGSNLHYAAEAVPLPAPSPHWIIYEIDTDYHFGFDFGLRGIFHSTNTNLTLNWEHLHSTDSTSKQVASDNMIGPFFEIGPDAAPYKQANGKATFHFDAVNLNYGQFINFGDRLQTNLFSGVSFARIKQVLFSRFSSLDGTIVRTIQVPSLFIGFGPQFGFQSSYRIIKGLHFTGQAAASFLVGSKQDHTAYKALSPGLAGLGITPPNKQSTTPQSKIQVIPEIEGKLGLSYVFNFCRHYMIKLEAGYQAQVYIDAIQSIDMGSEVITPPVVPDTVGVFARTFVQTISNFTLAGPYFNLDFGF